MRILNARLRDSTTLVDIENKGGADHTDRTRARDPRTCPTPRGLRCSRPPL